MKHRAAQGNWKASRSCPGRGAAFVTLLRTAGTHVELSALCNLSLYSKMADHDPLGWTAPAASCAIVPLSTLN